MKKLNNIIVLGCGSLGSALVRGMAKDARFQAALQLYDLDSVRAAALAEQTGTRVLADFAQAAPADLVLAVVKPADLDKALQAASDCITPETLVVSCAAGRSIASINDALHAHIPGLPVVRVMPNVAAQVGQSVSAIVAGPGVGSEQLAQVQSLFATVGNVHVMAKESLLHAVTALAASGPAMASLIVESFMDAGVRAGLPRAQAEALSLEMWRGTLALLDDDKSPAQLRAAVTSPAGTTAEALAVLESGALRGLIGDAVIAAQVRSKQLGS